MSNQSSALKYFWNFLMCALGLLFIVNSIQTYQSLKVLDINASRSDHTKEILQLVGKTYFAVQNAELHLRNYMLDNNDLLNSANQENKDKQLTDYNQSVNDVKSLIAQLQSMDTELPIQRSRFEQLLDMINTHNQALADVLQRHAETQSLKKQHDTTLDDLIQNEAENDKEEAQSLSDIMAASHQSLNVLSELINAIEKEELNYIQEIMDESAEQRKKITQTVLFANFLGIGFIIIIAVLTSRTARQQQDYAKAMERRVQERTHALELYAQELNRSNRELQSFAFVASHDLQEPLRKIRAFGDRLNDRYSDALGDGKDYVERMQSAATRMSKLIEDLLTFSRVTTRRKPFENVNLNDTLAGVLDDLQFKIEETHAVITLDNLPTLSADPTQMSQLFLNLTGNALKFIAPGTTPAIQVTVKEVQLPAISSASGEQAEAQQGVEISITDNGIGFDEQFLDKVFGAFQRLHNRDDYEGTGIGLAICRKITERHNGSIIAHSQPGAGATFIVTLPLEQPEMSQLSDIELELNDLNNSFSEGAQRPTIT